MAIEVEGYAQLQKTLRQLAPQVQKDANKQIKIEADRIASDAKAFAVWSERIPGAISVTANSRGAGLKVSSRRAPHGRLFERGSGRGRSFRHPVFGNRDVWVSQQARPYLEPAIKQNQHWFLRSLEGILREAIRKAGG